MSVCFFILVFLFRVSNAESPSCWGYSISGEKEKTERCYILIFQDLEKKTFRKISVVSQCEIPLGGDGSYGKCSHRVMVEPGTSEISLSSGEDVILLSIPRTYPYSIFPPFLFGTIEYGCCLNPDVVRYYSENGEYLGKAERFGLRALGTSANLFTRKFEIGNIYSDKMKVYILLSDEKVSNQFQVLKIEKGKVGNRIPVVLKNLDYTTCEVWQAQRFEENVEGKGIDLDLKGSFCQKAGFEERHLVCHDSPGSVICTGPSLPVGDKKSLPLSPP